jgi:hypothetical protein
MNRTSSRRTGPPTNASELHRQWLELVDVEGPFLAVPALKRVWPNGIPDFRSTHPGRFDLLADARKDFERAWEALDRKPDDSTTLVSYRTSRDKWVETVVRDVIGWAESLEWGPVAGVEALSPNRVVTVTPQAALVGTDGIGAVVHVIDPTESLRQIPNDLWAATPIDRLEALLRENGIEIGIVTDGRWWGLVSANPGSMTASGIFDALTWIEEPRARDAFLTVTSRQYVIGGDQDDRLPALFEESVAAAEEITEALGAQVRRAVELLIQSFSESAAEAKRRGHTDPLPERTHDTYEAAMTVMMRAVFLLFAEERGLLPSGELFEQGYGLSSELSQLSRRETEEGEEALDATSHTWHRLLATSQALFRGASFENLRMPAYGGSLFDPARFPFLTSTADHGGLAVIVSDRVMLHVLRSIQVATVQGEARQISFRDVDVEQIGYIYEGLLGYTCTRVDETYVGLIGTTGAEPEIPLSTLEAIAADNPDPKKLASAIRDWIATDQPSAKPASESALTKAVRADPDPSAVSALTQAVGDDAELRDRIEPWLGVVRRDLRNHPFVVIAGGLLVKETPSRKNAGAHYTPKSLAEEVVLHALQPLCYAPGPHQTADEAAWKLKTSDELLDLKVADIACGSGAFLVASARYLAERVVEAWISEDPANARRKDLYTRAIRQVVANCLYGADINDMAVEMCKLSLWLVSLDRDLPFSFVDDRLFLGNSLLGLTKLDQLRKLHIDPTRVPPDRPFDIFDIDIDRIIHKAVDLRERLASEIDEDDPARSTSAKHRQLGELRSVTASLSQIADGVIAAGLALGGKPGKALDEAYDDLRLAVKEAHPGPTEDKAKSAWLERIIARGLTPTVDTDYERWRPLHWVLAAPDVLAERGGFDAVVGNPPFLVGKKISGALGVAHREFLVHTVAASITGNADLVAFFLLRAVAVLTASGELGLVTAKSIAEGDTREVGLDQLASGGFLIRRAVRSALWPSRSAVTRYSIVWGSHVDGHAIPVLDGLPVSGITPSLEEGFGEAPPSCLPENVSLSFKGYDLGGDGFQLSSEEAQAMIADDGRNADVLFPYLNGRDLNSNPTFAGEGWVISFGQRSLEEAKTYRSPFARIQQMVLPVRLKSNRKAHRDRWWIYAEARPALTRALESTDRVIALSAVSRFAVPVMVPTGAIMSSAIVVIPEATYGRLAALSSSVHLTWVLRWGSLMKLDIRYSTSDVLDTFPFPSDLDALDQTGRRLEGERRTIMMEYGIGITELYRRVNDSGLSAQSDADIARMRSLHAELDEAVLGSYGWTDIELEYGFHAYRQTERWTVGPAARTEILARLLAENRRRAVSTVGSTRRESRRQPRSTDGSRARLFE